MTYQHRIGRAAVVLLAAGAVAAPTASARFGLTDAAPLGSATPVSSTAPAPVSEVAATGGYDFARVPATTVTYVSQPSSNGFDWGDAGIGAGAALGIIAALGGTMLVVRRHPQLRVSKLS